jgi:2-oxoisovalerate dehydrogenase E2 component (dihydrolipoyl transacylase)
MTDIILDPLLPESVEAGPDAYIAQWLVSEGDHVHAGQVLGRASLLHMLLDLPAPHAGTVEEITVPIGEKFNRRAVLARLVTT